MTLPAVVKHWSKVVDQVTPASVRMSLKNGTVTKVEKETVSVAFASGFHKEKVAALDASRTVEGVLQSIFKRQVRLQCTLEDQAPTSTDQSSVNLVEAAEEVFGSM